jgi:hypothetical protein
LKPIAQECNHGSHHDLDYQLVLWPEMEQVIKKTKDKQDSYAKPCHRDVRRGIRPGRHLRVFDYGTKIGQPEKGQAGSTIDGNTTQQGGGFFVPSVFSRDGHPP